MHHVCAWGPGRPEKETRSFETEVTDSCKTLCGCYELKVISLGQAFKDLKSPNHLFSP